MWKVVIPIGLMFMFIIWSGGAFHCSPSQEEIEYGIYKQEQRNERENALRAIEKQKSDNAKTITDWNRRQEKIQEELEQQRMDDWDRKHGQKSEPEIDIVDQMYD